MKATLMAIALAAFLAGCNTIAGAGRDIAAGGRVIADTAEDVRDEITDEN